MKIELADIATNDKQLLKGFKLFGIIPFYVGYIKTGTNIRLCKIKEELRMIVGENGPTLSDFDNADLQTKAIPLINKYCATALCNGRNRFIYWALLRKIKQCGHSHILNLYLTIYKLNEPAFFFTYWRMILKIDNTLLKEERPS